MGNRAVIAFDSRTPKFPAIYLHWNGGRASIEAFLTAAKMAGITRGGDDDETMDDIAELIAEHFFNVTLNAEHIYRMPYERADTDNGDNGTYIINRELEITGRLYVPDLGYEEEVDAEKTMGMINQIADSRAAAAARVPPPDFS